MMKQFIQQGRHLLNGQHALKALLWAMFLTGIMVTSIHQTTQRIDHGMRQYGRQLLGADVLLTSDDGMPSHWQSQAKAYHLQSARALQWTTMTQANNHFQLVTLFALPPILINRFFPHAAAKTPLQGNHIYVAETLSALLPVTIGQSLLLHDVPFRIVATHANQPFRLSQMRSLLAPTVWVAMSQVPQFQLFQKGAQVDQLLFVWGPPKNIKQYTAAIAPSLAPGQKMRSTNTLQTLGDRLQDMHQVLSLFAWFGILLAMVVVAMATMRFLAQHRQPIMLLTSFGIHPQQPFLLLLLLCVITLVVGLVGGALTLWTLQYALQPILPPWLQTLLPPLSLWQTIRYPICLGLMMGVAVLSPVAIFHHAKWVQKQVVSTWVTWVTWSFPVIFLMGFAWLQLGWPVTQVGIGFILLTGLCLYLIIMVLRRLYHVLRSHQHVLIKVAMGMTLHQWRHMYRQGLILGIISVLLSVWWLSHQALTQHWRQQLPKTTPNVFLLNVMQTDQPALQAWFAQHQLPLPRLYPAVRGRLKARNGIAIRDAIPASAKQHNALGRSLTFSEGAILPDANHITKGQWHGTTHRPEVSLEQQFAKALGFHIGDTLTISVQGQEVTAHVTSLRKLNWLDFSPNFYCFYSLGTFRGMNRAFFGSFYLPSQQRTMLLQSFYSHFPNIVVLDLTTLFQQIQAFSQVLSGGLLGLMLLLCLLAWCVFCQCLVHGRTQLARDLCTLQHLGADRWQRWRLTQALPILTLNSCILSGCALVAFMGHAWTQALFKLSMPTAGLYLWIGGGMCTLVIVRLMYDHKQIENRLSRQKNQHALRV